MSLSWFKASVPVGSCERVLIIHPFGLGDALFMTPLIRALKEGGVKQIDLLLGSRTRELFRHNPHVGRIYEWDKTPLAAFSEKWNRFWKLASVFFELLKSRYQAAIDLSPRAQYAFYAWTFRIPVRVGFNFKQRGFWLTHRLALEHGYSEKSVVEYYLDLARFLNREPTHKQLEFFIGEEDDRECRVILENLGLSKEDPILAVVPGGGESWGVDARLKRWPIAYFSELIQMMQKQYPVLFKHILILGGTGERELGEELLKRLNQPFVYNLCGKTSIRVAAALIQNAQLLIGNDGGLIHVAHAVDTPVIAFYGPTDPAVYGPYPAKSSALAIAKSGPVCRPCYQRFKYQAACQGVECLTQLTPNQALEHIRKSQFLEQATATTSS